MDPLSAIVGAITAAVAVLANGVANKAVSDAYDGLKSAIALRFKRKSAVEAVEEAPTSQSARSALQGALVETGASNDPEVIKLSLALAAAIHDLGAENLGRANINIKDLDGYRDVILKNLSAEGNVNVERVKSGGDIIIDQLKAGISSKT